MRRRCLVLFCVSVFYFFSAFQARAADTNNYFTQGENLLNALRWDEAIIEFERAIKDNPKDAAIFYNAACALACRGNYEQGIEYFQYALALETTPEFKAFIFFNLGGAYYKLAALKKDKAFFRKAEEYFHRAEELLPKGFGLAGDLAGDAGIYMKGTKRIDTRFLIGEKNSLPDTIALSQGPKPRGGWGDEERIFVIDENSLPLLYFYRSPATYIVIANEYIAGKNNLLAKQMLNAALDKLEQQGETPLYKLNKDIALEKLGFIFQEEGDLDKSTEYFQKALAVGYCEYPSVYVALGENYYEKKDYLKAKEEADKALKINPDYESAHNLLKRIIKGAPKK